MNTVHAIRGALVAAAGVIGLEGLFLAVGTGLLALAAGYVHPAGPLVVVGLVLFAGGLAIAIPTRSAR